MSQGSDPFEFIKNFWASMPGMGSGTGAPAMPSFDPQELEKRVAELKQVKQWLEMNLNMLNMQINTIEMQLTAVHNFENFTHNATQNANNARAYGAHAQPGRDAPPDMSQANEAAGAAAKAASDAGAQAFAQGAQALQAMPWANPGEWIKSMQAAFATGAPMKAAAKKSAASSSAKRPAKKAAKKRSAAKRAPKAP